MKIGAAEHGEMSQTNESVMTALANKATSTRVAKIASVQLPTDRFGAFVAVVIPVVSHGTLLA
jgi:hypothetical protein